jgi:hypothetical protein
MSHFTHRQMNQPARVPAVHGNAFSPARRGCLPEKLRRAEQASNKSSAGLPTVHTVLNSPGQPLDIAAREFMEPRFHRDFSQVRVHTDEQAASSARAINAAAFTVGSHVVFGAGRFAPGTRDGHELLAHELAHVVQQAGDGGDSASSASVNARRSEQEAAAAAHNVLQNSMPRPPSLTASPPVLMAQSLTGVDPTGAQPLGGGGWSTKLLTIILDSNRQNCFGTADETGSDLYSNCGSPERGQFCQSLSVPYEVRFFVDRVSRPRPQPITPPTVHVAFDFVSTSGKQGYHFDQTDSNPKYVKPNEPLAPSFGRNFSIGSAESGTLKVLIELIDSSGVNLKYSDKIQFDVVPCT